MTWEIGIAGWAFNRSIREQKSLTLLDFPRLAREEFGVPAVELVSTFFESQSARYLNDLRRELERHRLRVLNVAVDTGTLAEPDAAARRTDLEAIMQWLHVARALGAEAIRVNTGHADDSGALDRVVEGYRALTAHARDMGVAVLIENHGGVSVDPRNVAAILDRVPELGTCPDVNNFAGDSWKEGMRVMAPRARCVHVKISGYDPSGWQTREGRDPGRFDLRGSLRILKEAGFAGPVSFEYNSGESDEREGVRKGIAYTRELLAAL